jgi:hypothetical protein
MMRGLRLTAAVAVLIGVCFVGSASAEQRVSAPVPSLASVVLATTDFASGAQVAGQKSVTLAGQPAYLRVFKAGAKFGGQPLSMAISLGLLEADATTARADFADLRREGQTKAGRQAIAKSWGTDFVKSAKVKVKSSVASAPVSVGDGGFRLALTVSTNIGTLRMAIGFAQTDRIVEIVDIVGRLNGKIAVGDIVSAISAVKQHLQEAFTVASASPPTIGGTPQQGQTLTVDEGAWTGAPSGFTYVWSHCDATGNACAPIAGATANSYVPGTGDSGMTIRVGVTGANSVTSQQATSLPSPPIP